MAAPKNNLNNFRHGLRCSLLPPGCSYITAALSVFRRTLEATVTELRGEITLVDAALIQTAYRYERHAQLAQRWLRKEGDSMNPTERLNCSAAISKASNDRDKVLEKLGIDRRRNTDVWDVVHGKVVNGPASASEPASRDAEQNNNVDALSPEIASDGRSGPQTGNQ